MNKMSKKTACECPMAGYCERHGVKKSKHLHTLCQNHQGYFNMWEQCRGPNQNPNDCKPKAQEEHEKELEAKQEDQTKLPSTMTMAKNFVSSAAKHMASGFNNVTKEERDRRLAICAECPHIVNNTRCGKCGCVLKTKATWATSSCPIGKW